MPTNLVDYAAFGGVATITLNDPPTNAYTHEMMKDLDAAILEARFDNEVHVLVITGNGDKFFCAGANIRMLSQSGHGWKVNFCKFTNETRNAIEEAGAQSGQRYLAAVNGPCAGGGPTGAPPRWPRRVRSAPPR